MCGIIDGKNSEKAETTLTYVRKSSNHSLRSEGAIKNLKEVTTPGPAVVVKQELVNKVIGKTAGRS